MSKNRGVDEENVSSVDNKVLLLPFLSSFVSKAWQFKAQILKVIHDIGGSNSWVFSMYSHFDLSFFCPLKPRQFLK